VVQGNEIALNAAQAWIGLWQYSERLRLLQARTSEMDMLVEQIERMASNGMLDKASLENAQRQIVDIKLEESRLIAGQAEAQVLFQRFFNAKPSNVPQPSELVSATQARALAQDWQTAPGLQRQAAELLAAQAAVGEARSAFKPSARLQAGARSPLDSDESTDLTVGLSLEYSFNDGGRRKKQLEVAEARVTATDAQLSDAQRGLEAELQAGLTRLVSIERAMPLLADKLRLSRLEAETARSQMQTGQSNLRQLVEAEIAIYRAQDEQIAMQAEQQVLLLTIAARTGALSRLVGLQD
jgi:outer membrane protein TolC